MPCGVTIVLARNAPSLLRRGVTHAVVRGIVVARADVMAETEDVTPVAPVMHVGLIDAKVARALSHEAHDWVTPLSAPSVKRWSKPSRPCASLLRKRTVRP